MRVRKRGNPTRWIFDDAGKQKLSSRYITVNAGVYQPLNPGQIIENLDVNENDNVTVDGMDYIGNIEYQIYRYFDWDVTFEPAELKYIYRIHNPEGFATNATTTNGPIYSYSRKDHLGNNREVWRASYTWGSTTHPAATVQRTQYYPSGLPWKSNNGDNPGSQPYKYGGKEFVEMHGLDEYDSDARWYYPAIMRTTTMDPLAEKYYDISPYAWCGNNPVRFVDPDGRDWFYHSSDGKADPTWIWHDGNTYNTGVKDSNGKDVILQGQEAVVVFNGSIDERLGEDGTLTGTGAKSAEVTIYGIGGKNDIKTYNGLTVSSDPSKYSMVASGDYNLSWEQMATSPYGKGSLTYRVRQLYGNAELPIEGGEKNKVTGKSYLGAIFFHRTNWNGGAKYSSQGCLIIDGRQWRNVEKQLEKSKNILMQINRK